MTAAQPERPRRTQAARREESRARLAQACIDCLVEKGYHQTSTQAVATQAGLSQGALFRHFNNRLALLEHTANVIAGRFIDMYRQSVDGISLDKAEGLVAALRALRDVTRSAEQLAWFELQQAARTDEDLSAVFRPIFLRNQADNVQLASELFPEPLARLPMMGELIQTLIQIFHGQTLDAHIEQSAEKDEQMLMLVTRLAEMGLAVLGASSSLAGPKTSQ